MITLVSTVTSDDESDSGNDIEISVSKMIPKCSSDMTQISSIAKG